MILFLLNSAVIAACIGFLLSCDSSDFMVFDSNRKVGGIRFMKIGRVNLSLSISRKEA